MNQNILSMIKNFVLNIFSCWINTSVEGCINDLAIRDELTCYLLIRCRQNLQNIK